MKILIAIVLTASTFTCYAQNIFYPNLNRSLTHQPVYYIDSIKINSTAYPLQFINPNQIKSITVKGDERDKNAEVYIKLFKHNIFEKLTKGKQLSFQEILTSNAPDVKSTTPVLFVWDDKLITDTANIRFPRERITSVTLIKASEAPYFKTAFPNLLILIISTKPIEINIRGSEPK